MNPNELALRSKLLVGLNLSYSRLVEQKQKEDGSLIFTENGKIIKVKARKLSNVIVDTATSVI